jgi:hypothetical protein
MNLFETILVETIEELLVEKTIKVKHMKPKARAKAKLFRTKNKAKLKLKRKRLKFKLRTKPKKKGFSYGSDGKIHRVVRRKGVRKHH